MCFEQEDIALVKENTKGMSRGQVRECKDECGQLEDYFKALHEVFEGTEEKQANLEEKLAECNKVCRQHLSTAKIADTEFKSRLEEEKRKVEKITQLHREGEQIDKWASEQIKWCSDFVTCSQEHTRVRIDIIRNEIVRMQELEKQETDRLKKLASCKEQLDKVKVEERVRSERASSERADAMRSATERMRRAGTAVKSSERSMQRIESLYAQVQEEFKDALAYGTELRKALAVDCHAAYLGHGKYLAIQREKAIKNLSESQKAREAKLQKSLELDRLEDEDCESTVERAADARRELEKAERDVEAVNDKIKTIDTGRKELVDAYGIISAFLRDKSCSSNGNLVVETLPMAPQHRTLGGGRLHVSNVAEFRDTREDTRPFKHTLEKLEVFEADFKKRYRGEVDSNLKAMFSAVNRMFGKGLIGQ